MIALPIRSFHDDASRVAALCEQQGIILRLLSNIFDLKMARSRAEDFEGDSFITHYTGVTEGWPVVMKRTTGFLPCLDRPDRGLPDHAAGCCVDQDHFSRPGLF